MSEIGDGIQRPDTVGFACDGFESAVANPFASGRDFFVSCLVRTLLMCILQTQKTGSGTPRGGLRLSRKTFLHHGSAGTSCGGSTSTSSLLVLASSPGPCDAARSRKSDLSEKSCSGRPLFSVRNQDAPAQCAEDRTGGDLFLFTHLTVLLYD